MRRYLGLSLAALLTLTGAGAAPQLPFKVLVFSLTTGFRHGPAIDASIPELTKLGAESGLFTVDHSEELSALSAENLRQYRVVIFSNTTGNWKLTDAQRAEFIGWVKGGGGFIGAHAATDTNYDWPDYGDLIGGWFDGHPWHQEVGVIVEDPSHPAAEGVPPYFTITDEIYQHRNWARDKVRVVMKLDTRSVDMTLPAVKRKDGDFGLVWCKEYGQGRSLYSAFGHRPEVWRDPRIHAHLLGCIKWAAKLDWQSDPELKPLVAAQDAAGLAALAKTYPAALASEPVKAVASLNSDAAAVELANLMADSPDLPYPIAAITSYGGMTAGGLEPLMTALGAARPNVRIAALGALARRGGGGAETAILETFDDTDADVRAAAMRAAGAIGSTNAKAKLLETLAAQPDQAAAALAVLSAGDARTRAALAALLSDPRPEVRGLWPEIIKKLAGRYGDDAVFAGLVNVIEQDGPALDQAALAIAESGRADATGKLEAWIFDPRASVASAASRASATIEVASDRLTAFIQPWRVVGGFPSKDGLEHHDTVLPPEEKLDWAAKYGEGDAALGWQTVEAPRGRLDFRRVCKPTDNAVGYAATVINAPRATEAELRLGSDDGCKAWLNGEEILDRKAHRGLGIDADRANVKLREGANLLLVKVSQGGGDWLLMVRLSRAEGGLQGVTFSAPE